MILEKKMYTVICDNCGKDSAHGTDYSCWADPSTAFDMAGEDNWIKENGKHYCGDCWTFDDDDNLIIKKLP